jgi:hypothetical protein
VLQQNVLAKSLDENNLKSPTVLLFVELTLQWRWQLRRNKVILLMRVMVQAMGVKMLKQ